MRKNIVLLLTVAALLLAVAPAGAAPNWTTMHEDQQAVHQIDTDRVIFSGDAPDRQVEVWMKSIVKNGANYIIARYQVREKGLYFILKERTMYSPAGQAIGSTFVNKTDNWSATTAGTPIGAIATRLFADHANNPAAFPAAGPEAEQPGGEPVPEKQPPQVNPQELKQALEDERIKHEEKNGAKWYYVRDTHTVYYFLSKHRMTADFYLFPHGDNGKQTRQLHINLNDTRTGTHSTKQSVTVRIDGKEWHLRALTSSPGAGGSSGVSFTYHFNLPDSLIEALFATKTGVTVKWQYMYGEWKNLEYTIPDKIVRDIQMMYAGCK